MKLLVGMNLSPEWVPLSASHGWDTRHCEDALIAGALLTISGSRVRVRHLPIIPKD